MTTVAEGRAAGSRTLAVATWLLSVAGVAGLYYGAARLGLMFVMPNSNASPVWPASGIAFAAVMLLGYRVWPGIAIGAFLANLYILSPLTDAFTAVAASCGIGVGNTLEHVVGVFLLRRLVGSRDPLAHSADVFRFVLAAAAGCLIASANGAANVCWWWQIVPAPWQEVWLAWWLGDTAGILIFAPVILALFQKAEFAWTRLRLLEVGALFALLAAATQFLFGDYRGWIDPELMHSLPYAVVPGLAWAAFRFGPRETALSAALVSVIAIANTSNGSGPFTGLQRTIESTTSVGSDDSAERQRAESLLMLQIFALAVSVTAATLAGAVAERNRSEQELRDLNTTLEQRVADRTAELRQANTALERSNQELDDFAHIASHDLKEPLRGIHSYSAILLEDFGDKLDADGQSKLGTLQRLSRRMESLIQSLLTYSKVGRTEMAVQDTSLNDVLAEILDSLDIGLQERGIQVRIPRTLPTILCDRVRVGEVFRNLITNAMKYNDKPQKWIEVGFGHRPTATDAGGNGSNGAASMAVFHVRDNGIGIAEHHLELLFRIFKRLHGRDEYGGGTGIGLTIVKKIVERHGGRIWVESTAGEGTTFFFTLEKG